VSTEVTNVGSQFLARTGKEPMKFFDREVLDRDETDFAFSLPPTDGYRVAVYRDENGDGLLQENKPVWLSNELRPGDFGDFRRSQVLQAELQPGLPIAPKLFALIRAVPKVEKLESLSTDHRIPLSLGKIDSFASPHFTPEVGHLGLWEPLTSLNHHGVGIYFLEPFIAVLLVHGAGGTPADWEPFVQMLDKTKYQFWLYSYPSGLRIEQSARRMTSIVGRLHERYGFKRLDVIAHSIGGLVTRQFLLNMTAGGAPEYLRKYVTLSTPWAGHEIAALGVNYSPAVAPCWLDQKAGSEFQAHLFERALPESIEYRLGFSYSYQGVKSIVMLNSNDGVVSVASQLALSAQEQAQAIRGFDESHVLILASPEVAAWVGEFLATPPKKMKKT